MSLIEKLKKIQADREANRAHEFNTIAPPPTTSATGQCGSCDGFDWWHPIGGGEPKCQACDPPGMPLLVDRETFWVDGVEWEFFQMVGERHYFRIG